jgi:sugar/nucleoside kinase (ribokinase family)
MIDYVIAGTLRRDYILPFNARPQLDVPGGSALYAASGLLLWADAVSLLARIGEDYPREWLRQMKQRGMDTSAVQIVRGSLDVRRFLAYTDATTCQRNNPVSHFARLGLPFPKPLLGYQPPTEERDSRMQSAPHAPRATEITRDLLDARAVHIAPYDFVTHTQLVSAFSAGNAHIITLDPSPGYMTPTFYDDLRFPLRGLSAFLPSEEELRALFWGRTNDLWEMASALGEFGCETIVIKRGARGQAVYISATRKRYEIPPYAVNAHDLVGVGDSFAGGFLAGYLQTLDPLQAALYGNISAAFNAEGTGAYFSLDAMPGLAHARLQALRDSVREI